MLFNDNNDRLQCYLGVITMKKRLWHYNNILKEFNSAFSRYLMHRFKVHRIKIQRFKKKKFPFYTITFVIMFFGAVH